MSYAVVISYDIFYCTMLLYSDRIMIQYIIWYCMYSKKLYYIILLYIRQWQIILYWVMFMYVCLYVSVHMSFNKSEWLHNQHIYKQMYIYIHIVYNVYVFWFKKKTYTIPRHMFSLVLPCCFHLKKRCEKKWFPTWSPNGCHRYCFGPVTGLQLWAKWFNKPQGEPSGVCTFDPKRWHGGVGCWISRGSGWIK